MSNPTVCAVCLVNGRAEMVQRAIRSFQEQTYPKKQLLIYDSSETVGDYPQGILVANYSGDNRSIGLKRNGANKFVAEEIIVHWDSDDWSHPNRIAEQVALLQASGKECVGYRDMLFWKTPSNGVCDCGAQSAYDCAEDDETPEGRARCRMNNGQAWLYTNGQPSYCLGTSLCYWRTVWEKRPFEDLPKGPTGMGEDHEWLAGVDSLGVSCMPVHRGVGHEELEYEDEQPRMIASVHGGNTTSIMSIAIQVKDRMLRRAPEWDAYCRAHMSTKEVSRG